jgi:8-oxo-dGTP diphosphatase
VDGDGIRRWQVGGGLLLAQDQVLLVRNRRRDGRIDWSPPGGVIDHGEALAAGLAREIVEETGLVVERWDGVAYGVAVTFPDLAMRMRVQAMVAAVWSGEVVLADPDGIVEAASFHALTDLDALGQVLATSPRWVREPFLAWVADPGTYREHEYVANGSSPRALQVRRVG